MSSIDGVLPLKTILLSIANLTLPASCFSNTLDKIIRTLPCIIIPILLQTKSVCFVICVSPHFECSPGYIPVHVWCNMFCLDDALFQFPSILFYKQRRFVMLCFNGSSLCCCNIVEYILNVNLTDVSCVTIDHGYNTESVLFYCAVDIPSRKYQL